MCINNKQKVRFILIKRIKLQPQMFLSCSCFWEKSMGTLKTIPVIEIKTDFAVHSLHKCLVCIYSTSADRIRHFKYIQIESKCQLLYLSCRAFC